MGVTLACPIPVPPDAERCRPSSPRAAKDCSRKGGFLCCSDDPAALDLDNLDAPSLPAYHLRGETIDGGTPLFSDVRNDNSESGWCIEDGSVPPMFVLPNGCPIPCNPTWDDDEIAAVCGPDVFCCQTVELDAADCVLDPTLGDDGCWRPARGDDIVGLGGLALTDWSAGAHATQQDPGGSMCESFVAGILADDAVLQACLRRLGVANQRGFCIGGPGVTGCPLAQPSFRDACEQLNDEDGRSGCA